MEIIVTVLSSLSIFGFLLVFTSFYLILCVHTKVSELSRFAIHGHNISAGFFQLYLTIGTTPTIILPCTVGYTSGLFSSLRILSPANQLWTQITMIYRWFAVFISLIRWLAVAVSVTERTKKMIVKFHVAQLFINIIMFTVTGLNVTDDGLEGAIICKKLINGKVPKEIFDTSKGMTVILSKQPSLAILLCNAIFVACLSGLSIVVCGALLIRNIRDQGESSRSSRFQANQRRLTTGVLFSSFFMVLGLGTPVCTLAVCLYFSTCSTSIFQICCFTVAIYPILSSCSLLMTSRDYTNAINRIFRKYVVDALKIIEMYDTMYSIISHRKRQQPTPTAPVSPATSLNMKF